MSRLPTPGSDNNRWGNILNDFLSVEHNTDGSLKRAAQITQAIADAAQALQTTAQVQSTISQISSDAAAAQTAASQAQTAATQAANDVAAALNQIVTIQTYDGSQQQLKLLAMSDGSVKAVPQNATAPAAPASLTLDIHFVYLKLAWASVSGATVYNIFRDSNYVTTTGNLFFYDENVTVGSTYTYNVAAVNQYGMVSAWSQGAVAYVDPSLNTAPQNASITVWPTNPAPNELVYVHVNANDIDVQQLAAALQTTVGSLQATYDPSTWIWQGV